jgi:uncharacterized membrane protein HdeD (DUF308 family)
LFVATWNWLYQIGYAKIVGDLMTENVGGMAGNVDDFIRSAWRGLWWDMLLLGILSIIFGLMLFFMPGLSIASFVFLFGLYAVAVGLLLLLQTVSVKDGNWWVRLLGAIVAFAAGAAVFLWPDISALSLLYVIAVFFIITGILQVISSIALSRAFRGEWLYFISGILSVIVGVLLILRPLTGAIAMAQTIGIFAIAYGVLIVVLALKLQGTMSRLVETA